MLLVTPVVFVWTCCSSPLNPLASSENKEKVTQQFSARAKQSVEFGIILSKCVMYLEEMQSKHQLGLCLQSSICNYVLLG